MPACLACTAARPTPVFWKFVTHPVGYPQALSVQNALVRHKIHDPLAPDWLLLLQHAPVYTTGRRQRPTEPVHLERHPFEGSSVPAQVVATLRGGLTTYHGPGQLVGYPIVNLASHQITTRAYVDRLLNLLRSLLLHPALPRPIETLDQSSDPHLPVGTFVGDQARKVASIGIQVRRRIASHGFALNVEKRAEKGFEQIVPCGLSQTKLVSIQSILEELSPPLAAPSKLVRVEDLVSPTVELFGKLMAREMVQASSHNDVHPHADPTGYQLISKL